MYGISWVEGKGAERYLAVSMKFGDAQVTADRITHGGDYQLIAELNFINRRKNLFGGWVVDTTDRLNCRTRYKFRKREDADRFIAAVRAVNPSVRFRDPPSGLNLFFGIFKT